MILWCVFVFGELTDERCSTPLGFPLFWDLVGHCILAPLLQGNLSYEVGKGSKVSVTLISMARDQWVA